MVPSIYIYHWNITRTVAPAQGTLNRGVGDHTWQSSMSIAWRYLLSVGLILPYLKEETHLTNSIVSNWTLIKNKVLFCSAATQTLRLAAWQYWELVQGWWPLTHSLFQTRFSAKINLTPIAQTAAFNVTKFDSRLSTLHATFFSFQFGTRWVRLSIWFGRRYSCPSKCQQLSCGQSGPNSDVDNFSQLHT